MNGDLNLVEILKDCPKGTPLYSPICGECEFYHIFGNTIVVKVKALMFDDYSQNMNFINFDSNGRYGGDSRNYNIERECLLFPSKNNRDWSQFIIDNKSQLKYIKFKAFDKVLVKDGHCDVWIPRLFAYYIGKCAICTDGNCYKYCIPYNEDTARLIGEIGEIETMEELNEKYMK